LSATATACSKKSRNRFLTELFTNFRPELVARLRRVHGDGPPDPEDVVQSAFTQMAAMKSHHHIEDPKAFLFKVALNVGRRSVGHVAATRQFLDHVLERECESVDNATPERLCTSRDRLSRLNQAMEGLTPKQREILIRSRVMGHTYQEIADSTGWSIATISRQLTRALAHLSAETQEHESHQLCQRSTSS